MRQIDHPICLIHLNPAYSEQNRYKACVDQTLFLNLRISKKLKLRSEYSHIFSASFIERNKNSSANSIQFIFYDQSQRFN